MCVGVYLCMFDSVCVIECVSCRSISLQVSVDTTIIIYLLCDYFSLHRKYRNTQIARKKKTLKREEK